MSRTRPAIVQFIAGVIVLSIGVLVYLLDRPSASVYLVPDSWTFGDAMPPVFGRIGAHLPTFAHTFAFALFTSAVLEPWRRSALVSCLGWWALGSLFEIAQRDAWATVIAARLPGWFADWPVLENVGDYFLAGRFDTFDLVSIGIAAACAYAVAQLSHR